MVPADGFGIFTGAPRSRCGITSTVGRGSLPGGPEQDEHLLDLPERAADLADGFLRRSAAGGQQAA
jgi:hypothetical protein